MCIRDRPYTPFLQAALDYGFVNKPRDADLLIRRMRGVKRVAAGGIEYSFVTKIVSHYLSSPKPSLSSDEKTLLIRGRKRALNIPLLPDGTTYIHYYPAETFRILPFWKVSSGLFSPEIIQDKLVLMGMTGEIFHDVHSTPLGAIPGVLLHSNSIRMMLSKDFITPVAQGVNLAFMIFFAMLGGWAAYRKPVWRGFTFVIGEALAFGGVSFLLSLKNYYGDFFSPLILIPSVYLLVILHKHITLIIETGELRKLALTDELTGLFTYRYFLLTLENEMNKASRYQNDLSLIIFDVDHFKTINDTYGHDQGNTVLKQISRILQQTHRKVDGLSRYGGDEFCIILPYTDESGALNFANRLKEEVEKMVFEMKGKTFKVTLSIGVADFRKTPAHTVQEFFECADEALYKAKKGGRNQICTWKASS